MLPWYGRHSKYSHNQVAKITEKVGMFMASKVDAEKQTDFFYMSTGSMGEKMREIGVLDEENIKHYKFPGPEQFGSNTKLLPALNRFLKSCPPKIELGLFAIVTDGMISDIDAVNKFSYRLIREIKAGRSPLVKFILIGVGEYVNSQTLAQLDNLTIFPDLNIWDFRFADQLKNEPSQIFTEVVQDYNNREIIADYGYVTGTDDKIIADYRDSGVPAFLDFEMPLAKTFTLHIGDSKTKIVQPLHHPVYLEQNQVDNPFVGLENNYRIEMGCNPKK
jgi:hypothetical protein